MEQTGPFNVTYVDGEYNRQSGIFICIFYEGAMPPNSVTGEVLAFGYSYFNIIQKTLESKSTYTIF